MIYSSTLILLVHVSVKCCVIAVTTTAVHTFLCCLSIAMFRVHGNPSMLLPRAPPLFSPPPPASSSLAPSTGGTGGPCLESWTGKRRTQPKWTCVSRRSAWVASVNKRLHHFLFCCDCCCFRGGGFDAARAGWAVSKYVSVLGRGRCVRGFMGPQGPFEIEKCDVWAVDSSSRRHDMTPDVFQLHVA